MPLLSRVTRELCTYGNEKIDGHIMNSTQIKVYFPLKCTAAYMYVYFSPLILYILLTLYGCTRMWLKVFPFSIIIYEKLNNNIFFLLGKVKFEINLTL